MPKLRIAYQAESSEERNGLERAMKPVLESYVIDGLGEGVIVEKSSSNGKSIVIRPNKYSKIQEVYLRSNEACPMKVIKMGREFSMIEKGGFTYLFQYKP